MTHLDEQRTAYDEVRSPPNSSVWVTTFTQHCKEKDGDGIICSQWVIDREDAHSTGQLGRKYVEASDVCHVVPTPPPPPPPPPHTPATHTHRVPGLF